ncbi:hypothetical protein APHAL10511_000214 [Amanita phalloides]|nr:hypothetical protein APHAL10511_000214 [Amanita phalloides]
MQELPSALAERAKVRGLLERQANGDAEAEEEMASMPLYQHLLHGLAYTTGSAVGYAPPSTNACLEAFSITNKVGLMAGARAWTKHFHRSAPADAIDDDDGAGSRKYKDSAEASAGWWGTASGPVNTINEKALTLFWKVMNGATWRNLHWLPHGVLVYEIRVAEGYGMRWSQDRVSDGTVPPAMIHPRLETLTHWRPVRKAITRALLRNVEDVERHKRSLVGAGVYVGLSGIALMENKINALLRAGLDVPELLRENFERMADRHVAQALRAPEALSVRGTRVSFLETSIGIVTLAILHRSDSSDDEWVSYVAVLNRAVQNIVHEDNYPSMANDDGCEVLYGRAGLLYALLLLRAAIQAGLFNKLPPETARQLNQLIAIDNLRVVVGSIIVRGRRGSSWLREELAAITKTEPDVPPLMWSWHQKRYLGGAHGVAGILQMLLSCPAEVIAPHIDDILYTVEWLISVQDENGNWPSSLKHYASSNELVQWCHGAPGILILLSTLLKLANRSKNPFPVDDQMKDRIALSLHRGAVLVYERGFLRKGIGLCHGVAGSVFALLATADVSHEIKSRLGEEDNQPLDYLASAVHLAMLATRVDELVDQREMGTPDRPWSLYEGMAGMCCAWAEVLFKMQVEVGKESVCGMPGYNDIVIEY